MLTGQKYGEGDSHANNVDSAVPNPEQTGENSPQSVNSAELAVEETTKTAAPAELAFNLLDPLPGDPNVIRADRTDQPITFHVPFFLRWQVRNYEQTCKLLGALDTIFWEFSKSRRAQGIEDDVNQTLAYRILQISFEDIIHEAAAQRIDGYKKPSGREYMNFEVPDLATGDPELDANPVLVVDSTTCTDLSKLHEWVSALQQMCRLQQKMNNNLVKIGVEHAEHTTAQNELITDLKRQVQFYEQVDKERQKQQAYRTLDRQLPDSNHYIDLTLYLSGGLESEVELVREALANASEAKLEEMLKHIVVDKTEDAFFKHRDYKMLQGIQAKLTEELTEVGYNNYLRAHYGANPQRYVDSEAYDHRSLMKHKSEFVDKYSVFTIEEGEETGENTGEESQESQAPTE